MTTKEKGADVDPITLSVVWNRLLTITRETGERVVHSAQSFVMANARDLGPVILDTDARIITSVEFLPCHCLLAEIPTKAILNKFGKLNPGDMVLANDAHIIHSGHLPDWTYLIPVYWNDELVYYIHFRGHVVDSGGSLSGSYFPRAYDCIAEGLNIPPVKIVNKGEIDEVLREVIFDNIRTPAACWADLMLIYGSMNRAGKDICTLIDKYGLDTVKACNSEMIRRDEEAMREQISEIDDGEYYSEMGVDWDGTTPGRHLYVRVKLTVTGDEMTFDFTGSDEQVDFINSPLGNTHAYVFMALFLTMDPSIPHNHGAIEPIHIIAPPGTIVNPTRPHTYGASSCSCGCEIYEACSLALADAAPDKASGCFSKHQSVDGSGRLPFIDPRSGNELEYFSAPFIEEGGSGAVKGFDGWEGVVGCPLAGVIYRGSVEQNEIFFPYLWWKVEFASDTEGPGEFVGSRGTYSERECVEPEGAKTILMSGDTAGEYFSPGGPAGAPKHPNGEWYIKRAGETEKEVFHTLDMTEFHNGDVLFTRSSGGSGWGSPLDRDIDKIREGVRDNLISIQRAKDVYGVVIKPETLEEPNPENIHVDYKATVVLRKKMKTKTNWE
ncbi:MAG: hydantoinase B/oxoprolinase family protein [Desulfatiglandales bacterium]|nr:hydantoinase B/oxoprolinase family protein [Desulfatiglandales bacterium]